LTKDTGYINVIPYPCGYIKSDVDYCGISYQRCIVYS